MTPGTYTGTGGGGNLSLTQIDTLNKGDSVTFEITGLQLKPGDNYSRAIRCEFEGAPTVNARLVIKTEVSYTPSDFSITNASNQSIGGTPSGTTTYFMPIAFTFGYVTNDYVADPQYYVSSPWISSTDPDDLAPDVIANNITSGIYNGFRTLPSGVTKEQSLDDNTVALNYPAKKTVQFKLVGSTSTNRKVFHLGFAWPDNYTNANTNYDYDILGTYLADHANGAEIKIKYTISLEQT